MKLTQKAWVTLFGACVASLIFAGTGYAQAKSVEAKYENKVNKLSCTRMNSMICKVSFKNIQSTKQCMNVWRLKKTNFKNK